MSRCPRRRDVDLGAAFARRDDDLGLLERRRRRSPTCAAQTRPGRARGALDLKRGRGRLDRLRHHRNGRRKAPLAKVTDVTAHGSIAMSGLAMRAACS
jgi:hypothetical protein